MKKVIFCLPGRNFSYQFMNSWTHLLLNCPSYRVLPAVSIAYSPVLYWVRDLCLGGNPEGSASQKPFSGKQDYDYLMWIDSDIIFDPWQFKTLLDQMEENKKYKILAGLYPLEDNRLAAHYLPEKENRYLTLEDVGTLGTKPFKVWYAGMGFMLVRRGVFEKLTYPWFYPVSYREKGGAKVLSADDASLCERLRKEAKIATWVDPKVTVGHEKSMVLRASLKNNTQ